MICSKIPKTPPPPGNVVPRLEKLCQEVLAKNEQANLQQKLNRGKEVRVSQFFVTDCLEIIKYLNGFFKDQEKYFLNKWRIFKGGLYLKTSISENITKKKQKNLKVTFCNPTEPLHCKSSINDTAYTEVFL